MKRKFKKGDRVLVRGHDLDEWKEGRFSFTGECSYSGVFRVKMPDGLDGWSQCRHIDEFRTGDKVQVRDSMNEEWKDAVYGCLNSYNDFKHYAFIRNNRGFHWKHCRWHPSMPWAKKEPLTLEQRVEALENKVNKLNTKEK